MDELRTANAADSDYIKKQDMNALHYKDNSQFQYNLVKKMIDGLHLRGNESILDIGCGDGKITVEFSRRTPQGFVVGTDISNSMIKLAKELFPQTAYPNLTFEVRDIVDLNLDLIFDYIICFSTIHWIKELLKAFKSMKKVLKPQGQIIIADYIRPDHFMDRLEEVVDSPKWRHFFINNPRPFQFALPEEYEKIIVQAGLEPVSIIVQDKVYVTQTQNEFKEFVRGWCPYLLELPPQLHDELLDEVMDKYIQLNPVEKNGELHTPYKSLIMIAKNRS